MIVNKPQFNVWIAYGKDEGSQFEASWEELVYLAEQILAHSNTQKIKNK